MANYYDPADIVRNKQLKPLSDETLAQIGQVKGSGQAFVDTLVTLPQSADMTLAKRKVEEAVMWAVKALTA